MNVKLADIIDNLGNFYSWRNDALMEFVGEIKITLNCNQTLYNLFVIEDFEKIKNEYGTIELIKINDKEYIEENINTEE